MSSTDTGGRGRGSSPGAGSKTGAQSTSGSKPQTESASNRLFDLRELMVGLFLVFGVILVVAGLFDGQGELDKAAGVRINLWTGIGMIVLALVFLGWRLWRPLKRENLEPADDDGGGAPQDPIAGH